MHLAEQVTPGALHAANVAAGGGGWGHAVAHEGDPQHTGLYGILACVNHQAVGLKLETNRLWFECSTEGVQPHPARRQWLLRHHPQVKQLCRGYPPTAIWVLALVALQLSFAVVIVPELSWPVLLVLIWCVGAPISHALFVLMHECCHDLVFRRRWQNQLLGICCDLAEGIPSAVTFRRFHLRHHAAMGQLGVDADLPHPLEGRLVGASRLRKALWMCAYGVSEALRPFSSRAMPARPGWLIVNLLVVVAVDLLILRNGGLMALVYVVASTFVALGPHPLAGRWLAEHFHFFPRQQTASMYGWGNLIAFNVGYHTEHHDLPSIPWVWLPRLKQMAPELYQQPSHRSWAGCLWRFVMDPKMTPFSRLLNPGPGRLDA